MEMEIVKTNEMNENRGKISLMTKNQFKESNIEIDCFTFLSVM